MVLEDSLLKVLLLGGHLRCNLEYFVKMGLEKLGCEVQFLGYGEFLGRLATPVRIIISRSKGARWLLEPVGLREFNRRAMQLALAFDPDLILSVKGEAVLPPTLDWFSEQLGSVTALWYPDDPRYFESLSKHIAPLYDVVFTASEKFLSRYRNVGVKRVEYLPFACEPTVHRPVALSARETRDLSSDICFVGTYSRKRAKLIAVLEKSGLKIKVWGEYWRYFKEGENFHSPVSGLALTKVFNAAKIVLNIHTESDLAFKANMRVFEASGCRSFLLSDRPWSLERSFVPGEELACYMNEVDLVRLARHYLSFPGERAAIAARAQQRAYSDHTYDLRAKSILAAVSKST